MELPISLFQALLFLLLVFIMSRGIVSMAFWLEQRLKKKSLRIRLDKEKSQRTIERIDDYRDRMPRAIPKRNRVEIKIENEKVREVLSDEIEAETKKKEGDPEVVQRQVLVAQFVVQQEDTVQEKLVGETLREKHNEKGNEVEAMFEIREADNTQKADEEEQECIGEASEIPTEKLLTANKTISFIPVRTFEQAPPISFPYVQMPKAGAMIKTPKKGTRGRKGHKEETFGMCLKKHFCENMSILNDRSLVARQAVYTPDFCMVYDPTGKRILVDIEIDEPYEGLNELTRKVTHFANSDIKRNTYFAGNGWIVIRFAEIQVHQSPNSCCRFIADVLKSIVPDYYYPNTLLTTKRPESIKQWSKEEAEEMSKNKYREAYLGISNFGTTKKTNDLFEEHGVEEQTVFEEDRPEADPTDILHASPPPNEHQYEKDTETTPGDIRPICTEIVKAPNTDKFGVINWAISNHYLLSFNFDCNQIVHVDNFKPTHIAVDVLNGYVGNTYKMFYIHHIHDVIAKRIC
jgi:hypothetical protein